RLTDEGPVPLDAFGGDPLVAAAAFVDAGARWLHVVDMDRALSGDAGNRGVLASIAAIPEVRVQVSGGIVDASDAAGPLEDGASRVVLSSRALADRPSIERTLSALGEAAVVGLEVDGERIRPRGGGEQDLPLEETVSW